MKKVFALIVVLIMASPLSYAGGMPEDMSGATTISFDSSADTAASEDRSLSVMEIYPGQEAVLKLKSDASAGFKWEIAGPWNENVLEYGRNETLRASGKDGLATEVWAFKGVKPGSVDLSFRYVDPQGDPVKGSRNAVFTVVVKPGRTAGVREAVGKQAPYNIAGTVEEVELSGVVSRVNPVLSLKKDNGDVEVFVVKPLVYVHGAGAGMVSFSEITPGTRVLVNYRINREGVKEAVVIQVL